MDLDAAPTCPECGAMLDRVDLRTYENLDGGPPVLVTRLACPACRARFERAVLAGFRMPEREVFFRRLRDEE